MFLIFWLKNQKDSKAQSAEAKAKMLEIRKEIESGKISFEDAARKYSDDKASGERGGVLNWFEVNKMVPQFIKAISDIDTIGGISYPVETDYGIHLIKLIDLRKVPPYEEYLPELKRRVAKDTRSNRSKEVAVNRFKEQYKYKEYPKALQQFYTVVDSSIFKKSWRAEKADGMQKPMFKLNGKKYTQKDFAQYVENNQRTMGKGTIKFIVHKLYNQWVNNIVLSEKDSQLESEEFDFRMLVNEYHDGILLFNISDEMVWSKAIKDSAGLADFHSKHASNYMWKKRLEAEVFRVKNDSIAKVVKAYLKQDYPLDSIISLVNSNSKLNIGYEKGKYEQGDNRVIDGIPWQKGVHEFVSPEQLVYIVRVLNILEPSQKSLNEARGLITADYQNHLHDAWIKDLRKKYTVKLNQKIFDSIEE
jgi:peptidyl-prolyl cis-trans isomerase SurA